MTLPWVRLDAGFPSHDKVLQLIADHGAAGKAAGFVFACSLAYSGDHGTDGLIPRAALPFIHGTRKDAERLVEAGLWHPDPKGWRIPNWQVRQQSAAVAEAVADAKRRAAVKGNCVRHHGKDCGCWAGQTT